MNSTEETTQKTSSHTLLKPDCSSHHSTLRCKNAGAGACRAVVGAEIAGQPLHAQRTLAQCNRFPLSELYTSFAYPSESGRHLRSQCSVCRGASPLEDSVSRTAARAPCARSGTDLCTPPRTSEFGTRRAQSSGFLGGSFALSVACAGGLALWRMASLQRTYEHPELVTPPVSELLTAGTSK